MSKKIPEIIKQPEEDLIIKDVLQNFNETISSSNERVTIGLLLERSTLEFSNILKIIGFSNYENTLKIIKSKKLSPITDDILSLSLVTAKNNWSNQILTSLTGNFLKTITYYKEKQMDKKKLMFLTQFPLYYYDDIKIDNLTLKNNEVKNKLMLNNFILLFNAFRYKVFCGTISIGVALAARKNSGINLPLILDDEFFASDITNRAEFEEYFKQIILAFRDITPEMPLQFILFTHDELVFESAREAVLGIDEESYRKNGKPLDEYWKCPLINNTKFARLFPYSQKEKTHKTMRDGSKYWNLLFEFGNNVKEQEVNES